MGVPRARETNSDDDVKLVKRIGENGARTFKDRTISEVISFKELGISKFRMLFPYFGLYYRVLRRIKREEAYETYDGTKSALARVSEILSKDKALNRDKKINQILK